MVDLKTLSERILAGLLVEKPAYCLAADRSNKRGFVGQIGPDRPVILNRIQRSFSGGRSGHFGADQSKNLLFMELTCFMMLQLEVRIVIYIKPKMICRILKIKY